jgi:transporter family-2 protein
VLYEGLALFSGLMIAVMVTANGLLTARVGPWMSVMIIHVVGLLTAGAVLLARRRRFALLSPGASWYLYLPGVIGVLSTMLNNLCYQPLGAALMLAVCVVGQILSASFIDHFGWFDMPRRRFRPAKLIGFTLMGLGLLFMTLW